MLLDFSQVGSCPHILMAVYGCYGIVILDRPEALNALTPAMIAGLTDVLRQWRDDKTVHGVIVRAQPGGRAFCAGGDVRIACRMVCNNDPNVYTFFRSEYMLNDLIHHYPKPVICFVDGIVMGGGAGIAMHCSIRMVTEKALFAMPETAIGFIPDIGSSYFLNQCTEPFGLYLALTGDRIGAGDLCASGLASDFISSNEMEVLYHDILNNDISVLHDIVKSKVRKYPEPALLNSMVEWRDCFMLGDIASAVRACKEIESANRAFKLLETRCPTSLVVTFAMMKEMQGSDLRACLQKEFTIATNMLRRKDFSEGVRAVVVEKTHDPKWSPPDLSTVNMGEVAAIMDDTNIPPLVF